MPWGWLGFVVRKEPEQVVIQEYFPLQRTGEAAITYKLLCHPAPCMVTDGRAGSVCCLRTANAKVPILVVLFQGLGCILTHSFKLKENCLKDCWF